GVPQRVPGGAPVERRFAPLACRRRPGPQGGDRRGQEQAKKVPGGAHTPDEGRIEIDGAPVVIDSVRTAKRLGIALIPQELMLAPNLDVAANVFLGNEGRRELFPLRRAALNERARPLLERVGLRVPSGRADTTLTAGQMQMVEIAKALALSARIIIMDEPTSSLTAGESEHLFHIIRQLRSEGMGIIYISHRMEEVMALSDRVTVLRDGRYVGDLSRAETTHDRIVSLMVGRELRRDYFPERPATLDTEDVLVVRDLVVPGAPAGVSFTAKRGEILGFAGLVGSGRTELMQTLFGITPALGGTIELEGKPFSPTRPRDAIDRGVYLAPEDRKRHGLVLPMSIA